MSVLRGTVVPRILLGIMGVLAILMAWGAIQTLYAYGLSLGSLLMVVISVSLGLICLSVAFGLAPFHIRE